MNHLSGRNEPCVCGSGRKFKRCCREALEQPAKLAREHNAVGTRIQRWVSEHHGEDMGAGINEVVGGREGIVLGDADLQLIGTWVISDRLLPNGRTLAQMYAERHDISQEERDVAGRIADARLSLLRIDAVTPGRCIDIYDLTRHEATCISSHDVSRSVRPGHVIVGRIMAGPPAPTLWGPVAFLDRRSSRELSELLTARVRALGLEDDPGALSAAVRAASREVTALLALAFREHPSARLAA